jgi:hypothetical protein
LLDEQSPAQKSGRADRKLGVRLRQITFLQFSVKFIGRFFVSSFATRLENGLSFAQIMWYRLPEECLTELLSSCVVPEACILKMLLLGTVLSGEYSSLGSRGTR